MVCEFCGELVMWCSDRAGDIWIRCENDSCSFFTQLELFPEEPLWEEGVDASMRRDDTERPLPGLHPSRISLEGLLPF